MHVAWLQGRKAQRQEAVNLMAARKQREETEGTVRQLSSSAPCPCDALSQHLLTANQLRCHPNAVTLHKPSLCAHKALGTLTAVSLLYSVLSHSFSLVALTSCAIFLLQELWSFGVRSTLVTLSEPDDISK